MKDGIPKGSGNSRFLKSVENFKTLYPTYDAFVAALVAGTLPIDLNGINPEGWERIGDALNKNTLLKDDTAAMFGLDANAVLNDVLAAIKSLFNSQASDIASKAKVVTGGYAGVDATSKSLSFAFPPKMVIVQHIGGIPLDPTGGLLILMQGQTVAYILTLQSDGDGFKKLTVSWSSDGKTVTWKSTSGNQDRYNYNWALNYSGYPYVYTAFG